MDSDPTRPESPSSSTPRVSKTSEGSTGLGILTSNNSKENVDITDNKTGTPNLSIQPQKMKKGKKNGGYNLRNSLAWDRAFFTEEGVLDSRELAKITGIPGDLNEHGTDPKSNNVGRFRNLETLEEDLFKELPSGNIKTKSSQRIPPRHDVSKTVFNGRVASSSPMAPTSQKRLLNTGATKITPRNSKIPKLPVSRLDACLPPMSDSKIPKISNSDQNTCLPSITTSRVGARRNSYNSNGISQSAQKNATSKVSFNSKNTSNATKSSSEGTPKSIKPYTENAKKDTAIPRSGMSNMPAQHTTKRSILSEMTSNKGPSTSGTGAINSVDKIRGPTVSSQQIADDNNKRNLQRQGVKPSGLRMPSPSLKFFGELKAPVSYVPPKNNPSTLRPPKSSIPVNLKAQLLPRVKSDLMDNCSSSSILDPTNCDVIQNTSETIREVQPKLVEDIRSFEDNPSERSMDVHIDFLKDNECSLNSKDLHFEDISNVSPNHANDEEGDLVIDKKWPMMDVDKCSVTKGKVRGKDYQQLKSGDWSLDDKRFSLNSKALDLKKKSNVAPEVQTHKMNANTEEDVNDTKLPLLNVDECLESRDNARENYDQLSISSDLSFKNLLKSKEFNNTDISSLTPDIQAYRLQQASHPCLDGTIDIDGSDICTSTSDTQCLDGISDANIESERTTAMVLVEDSTRFKNQVEISNDMNEVLRSSEKVNQTDFLMSYSGKKSKDQDLNMESMDPEIEKSCSFDSQHMQQPRNESMKAIREEYIEYDKSESDVSLREPDKKFFEHVNCISSENLCSKKDIDCICQEDTKDTNSKLVTSNGGEKLTRLAVNVVPFSDEWLAAIEAAGEEILTLKTGAVQNSPPDKSIPEPSPWSPVKKKTNQEIGPFDCTKYKNAQHISD